VSKILQINPEEAKSHLLELINEALKGEQVIIFKDLEQAVQLISAMLLTCC